MEVTIYHMSYRPIELSDRELATEEWRAYADEILAVRPALDDLEGWQRINAALDVKENSIREQYPCKKVVSFPDIASIVSFMKIYGALSFCLEDENLVGYIGDLPTPEESPVQSLDLLTLEQPTPQSLE